jgi:hypothetical protein
LGVGLFFVLLRIGRAKWRRRKLNREAGDE